MTMGMVALPRGGQWVRLNEIPTETGYLPNIEFNRLDSYLNQLELYMGIRSTRTKKRQRDSTPDRKFVQSVPEATRRTPHTPEFLHEGSDYGRSQLLDSADTAAEGGHAVPRCRMGLAQKQLPHNSEHCRPFARLSP